MAVGMKRAGFDIIYSFDNNKQAVQSYNDNVDACVRRDAYNVSLSKEMERLGVNHVDLIAGGPPCQGFSMLRKGDDNDPRNDLVRVFFNMAFDVRPRFILMENVLGIKGPRGVAMIRYVKEECAERGYHFHSKVLNAADFGAPQIRKRYFIVAERGSDKYKFPTPSHHVAQYKTVQDAIGDLPSPPKDGTDHPDIVNHRCDVLGDAVRERFEHVPQGGGRDSIPYDIRTECHKHDSNKVGHRDAYGRLKWDEPSGTITTRFDSLTRGKFGHPEEQRSLSLREGARLQTFPDEFRFTGSKLEVARQIGNAVPPVLSEVLGKSIIARLREIDGAADPSKWKLYSQTSMEHFFKS